MKLLHFSIFLLITQVVSAQGFSEKLYDKDCKTGDTTNTIVSEFLSLNLNLPEGWVGEFEGDYPTLYARKVMDDKKFTLILSETYCVDGKQFFKYVQDQFEMGTYDTLRVSGRKVLISSSEKSTAYVAYFYCNASADDYYMWRVELRGAKGREDWIKCDFSIVLNELILKNSN